MRWRKILGTEGMRLRTRMGARGPSLSRAEREALRRFRERRQAEAMQQPNTVPILTNIYKKDSVYVQHFPKERRRVRREMRERRDIPSKREKFVLWIHFLIDNFQKNPLWEAMFPAPDEAAREKEYKERMRQKRREDRKRRKDRRRRKSSARNNAAAPTSSSGSGSSSASANSSSSASASASASASTQNSAKTDPPFVPRTKSAKDVHAPHVLARGYSAGSVAKRQEHVDQDDIVEEKPRRTVRFADSVRKLSLRRGRSTPRNLRTEVDQVEDGECDSAGASGRLRSARKKVKGILKKRAFTAWDQELQLQNERASLGALSNDTESSRPRSDDAYFKY